MVSIQGREQERGWLRRALEPDRAIVQVVGPAGIGKTTLTRAVLSDLGTSVWTSLETVPSSGVLVHLATAVGCRAHIDALLAALSEFDFVVFDGAESHEIELHELMEALSSADTDIRVVITSQRRLVDCHSLNLGPLDTASAMDLFRERGRLQALHGSDDETHVRQLVERLDGWPLAIELAASRLRLFTPLEMLEEDLFEILQNRRRSGRHSSLESALDGAFAALEPDEQKALARLSLFCGAFSRQSFKDLTGHGLSMLERLLDASLVTWDTRQGRRWYRLLGAVRLLAQRNLATDDPAIEVYADMVLDRAEEAMALLHGAEARRGYEQLASIEPDLVAVTQMPPTRAAKATIALTRRALMDGPVEVALQRLRRVDATGLAEPLATELRSVEAEALISMNRREDARSILQSIPETPRTANLRSASAPDAAGRLQHSQRALQLARTHDDVNAEAVALQAIGVALRRGGDPTGALASFAKAREHAREHGLVGVEAAVVANQSLAGQDRFGATETMLRDLRVMADRVRGHGNYRRMAQILLLLGNCAVALGSEDAADIVERVAADGRRLGMSWVELGARGHAIFNALDRDEIERATAMHADLLADGRHPFVGDLETLAAHLAWREGDTDAALRAFRSAMRAYESVGVCRESSMVALTIAHLEGSELPNTSDWPDDSPVGFTRVLLQAARSGTPLPQVTLGSVECRLLRAHLTRRQAVTVALDGTWFDAGAGRVSLSRRKVLTRVLAVLARRAGQVVELETLLKEAWPGEKMRLQSGRARVHVAMSDLRKLGLREVLETVESDLVAYRLDADSSAETL